MTLFSPRSREPSVWRTQGANGIKGGTGPIKANGTPRRHSTKSGAWPAFEPPNGAAATLELTQSLGAFTRRTPAQALEG